MTAYRSNNGPVIPEAVREKLHDRLKGEQEDPKRVGAFLGEAELICQVYLATRAAQGKADRSSLDKDLRTAIKALHAAREPIARLNEILAPFLFPLPTDESDSSAPKSLRDASKLSDQLRANAKRRLVARFSSQQPTKDELYRFASDAIDAALENYVPPIRTVLHEFDQTRNFLTLLDRQIKFYETVRNTLKLAGKRGPKGLDHHGFAALLAISYQDLLRKRPPATKATDTSTGTTSFELILRELLPLVSPEYSAGDIKRTISRAVRAARTEEIARYQRMTEIADRMARSLSDDPDG